MARDPKFNQTHYDAASISVANGQTNRDIKTNESALWNNVQAASYIRITTDATVTIRFNATTYGGIVQTSSEVLEFDSMKITNMYVTNASWGAAAMKIILME